MTTPRPTAFEVGAAAGLFALVFAWCFRPMWNIDFGWHIALGRWILSEGWPQTDVLSAAREGQPWTTFQGGYEVVAHLVERAVGLQGFKAFHAAALAAGFTLFYRHARRLGASVPVALAATLAVLVTYEDRIRARPHVFHFLLTMAFLIPVVRGRAPRTLGGQLAIAAGSFVWAACHAPGSLWAPLLLGTVAVCTPKDRRAWLAVGSSVIGIALAPGAASGLISAFFVHTTDGLQAAFVPEHANLVALVSDEFGLHGKLVVGLAMTAVLVGAGLALRRLPGITPLTLAAAGLSVLALALARFAWATGLWWLVVVQLASPLPRRYGLAALTAVGLLFAADGASYVLVRYESVSEWSAALDARRYPVGAANFLDGAGIHGQIWNEPSWGGYLLYRTHPNSRTLTDGRIAFGGEVGELLLRSDGGWPEEALRRASTAFDVDLAVRRPGVLDPAALPDWTPLYRDDTAEVWARRDANLASRLERTRQFAERR